MHGHVFNLADVTASVPLESINDLATNHSAFSVTHKIKIFSDELIIIWLKLMIGVSSGKSIPIKILASRLRIWLQWKVEENNSSALIFNNIQLTRCSCQKESGLTPEC